MDNKKPATTEKIVLPKSLQREMIKFFAQASIARNAANTAQDKENQQTLEISKKGVLIVDKHRHLRSSFHRGTSAGRIFHKGAGGKITRLCHT